VIDDPLNDVPEFRELLGATPEERKRFIKNLEAFIDRQWFKRYVLKVIPGGMAERRRPRKRVPADGRWLKLL